ncbi:MAG TPA: hypothetical protein VFB79_21390 [Candidatus Angelobacter sp.]|nr:hypothetical protein [Candidatus Angelobacter sp.]
MSPWLKTLIAVAIVCLLIVTFAVSYSLLHRQIPTTSATSEKVAEPTPSPAKKAAAVRPTAFPTPASQPTLGADPTPIPETAENVPLHDSEPVPEIKNSPEPLPPSTDTWVSHGTTGVALEAMHWRAMPFVARGTKVKVEIDSDSGVTVAVASLDSSQPNGIAPNSATCVARKIFHTSMECPLPSSPVLVLVDQRQVGSALSALLSRGRNADKIAAQNKVNITMYTCDDHCE